MKIDLNHPYFAQGYFLLRYIVVLFGYDMFVRPFSEVLINAHTAKSRLFSLIERRYPKKRLDKLTGLITILFHHNKSN